jgi:hypothetical protein
LASKRAPRRRRRRGRIYYCGGLFEEQAGIVPT